MTSAEEIRTIVAVLDAMPYGKLIVVKQADKIVNLEKRQSIKVAESSLKTK